MQGEASAPVRHPSTEPDVVPRAPADPSAPGSTAPDSTAPDSTAPAEVEAAVEAGVEAGRLAEVLGLDLLDTAPEPRFDRLTELAAHIFGVATVQLNLVAADRQWSKSQFGPGEREVERSAAFCDRTISSCDGLVVEDAGTDPAWRDNRLVTGESHIRFYAGHPLYGPGGHAVGALCLVDTEPRRFSEAERATLRSLARLAEREVNHQEEVDRAAAVQRSLLPARGLQVTGWDIAGDCVPAHGVGGDFFDWYVASGRPVVTVADVMGKGLSASILAATARAVLRSVTRNARAAEAVMNAGYVLADDLEVTGTFVTAFHCVLHDDGAVDYADAGHGLALVVRADPAAPPESLGPRGLPMGVVIGEDNPGGCVRLGPGDTLVVVSDGVLDLVDSVADGGALVSAAARRAVSARDLIAAVRDFAAGRTLTDDLTVVVVRRVAGD